MHCAVYQYSGGKSWLELPANMECRSLQNEMQGVKILVSSQVIRKKGIHRAERIGKAARFPLSLPWKTRNRSSIAFSQREVSHLALATRLSNKHSGISDGRLLIAALASIS